MESGRAGGRPPNYSPSHEVKENGSIERVLRSAVPDEALSYCIRHLRETPVSVALTRSRKSKWGDYRIHPNRPPAITVNGDLPPPFLLMTLLHELAHHHVHLKYGLKRVAPHGIEWKSAFQALMQPLMGNDRVFPSEMVPVLNRHMQNPKANAISDAALYRVYLTMTNDTSILLESLEAGSVFSFRHRSFKVKELMRKRIVCECLLTRRNYLFQPLTPVEI